MARIADNYRCVFVFIMPIGLNNIGWKMYIANGSWDVAIAVLIVSCPFSDSLKLDLIE